jgi:hypothetical protein
MTRKNLFITLLVCAVAFCRPSAKAQLTLTRTNYFQNFNAISNGLPAGWSVRTNATAASLGINVNFSLPNKTWGDTTGEFGNCASTTNNPGTNFIGNESTAIQTACTNRAFAVRQTAAFGDPGAAFVLQITNTIGLSNLTFTVDLDMLKANSYSTTWTIQYAVGNSPTTFITLGAYSDPGAFGTTSFTANLGADASNQSSNIWIRVVALSPANGTSGSRDTFALDNFSLSWTTNNISAISPLITDIIINNGNVQIDFSGDITDSPTSFVLQSAANISDTFGDTAAIISQINSGIFRAVCAMNGSQQFYKIKRP